MSKQEFKSTSPVGQVRISGAPTPIRRMTTSQQVYNALRDRIVGLELLPGQSLSRVEVTDTYGVSQMPVREAMQKLAEEGLLVIFPQSKTVVSRIDIVHAQETQFLRLSLELEVIRRLALTQDRSFMDEIDVLVARQERALEAEDMVEFSALDHSFHRRMCGLIGVESLWDLVTARSGHIDRLRNLNLPDPGKSASIMECHHRIASAIRAGDPAAGQKAVRDHLSGTLARVDDIRKRHPDFF
ncbi:GntR family transcriptional regulator [Sulfitobacter sp.]|uniref:GntR family transcriptional regulator n=1 Tax=Sulfitobacter sp. TaxID=1903071 RepID=UPI003567C2BE